jgi:hypothetical protein
METITEYCNNSQSKTASIINMLNCGICRRFLSPDASLFFLKDDIFFWILTQSPIDTNLNSHNFHNLDGSRQFRKN